MKKAIHYLLTELVCANQTDLDGETRLMGTAVDMGADEICPDCNDVYNPYDWNADGLVNLDEFARFSRAWLTYDPNNPLCDPNNPNYVSDPNAPGYISDLDKAKFVPACDLNRDLDVDLADLQLFLEDSPWLWWACWRMDIQQEIQQMAMMMAANSSQQTMAMSSATMESKSAIGFAGTTSLTSVRMVSAAKAVQPMETVAATEAVETASVEVEPVDILSLLESVDSLIAAGGDDAETWMEVKNLLEQTLVETEDTEIKTAEF